MNAFEQAMKINDTPFPFPYAQTVTMMLWFQALMCPMMMVAWLNNTWIVSKPSLRHQWALNFYKSTIGVIFIVSLEQGLKSHHPKMRVEWSATGSCVLGSDETSLWGFLDISFLETCRSFSSRSQQCGRVSL